MKRIQLFQLFVLLLIALTSLAFTPLNDEGYWARQLRLYGKMNLPVTAILQSKLTSCGPAVITMAYNYAYPEIKIDELSVIAYATQEGFYTESKSPFTSPQNMIKVVGHYVNAKAIASGAVTNAEDGLVLLTKKLTSGDPVIIDVLARLYDSDSGAHFVLVTGLALDKNPNKTKIYFNDPLTGTNRWGYWLGGEGVWNAWKNNNDPGGSGWWMIISSP